MRLGVNIDHVATLREARKDVYPVLLDAAKAALKGGADGVTIHLREDRRHIQDKDLSELRKLSELKHLNLEMAVVDEIAEIALKIKPDAVCLVPEKRAEITTEGGLDAVGNNDAVCVITQKMQAKKIAVSLFIDPNIRQIDAAKKEWCRIH